MYAIDYPGPNIQLPFHYDCNDTSDYKAQVLLEKTPGAPSLWVGGSPNDMKEVKEMTATREGCNKGLT